MYNSCTGSTSHGAFNPFEEPFGGDFKLQNARPSPFCLYSQTNTNPKTTFPPNGNCIGYFPNEWMTFQIHIKVGQWDQWNSTIQLWVGREGQPSQLIIDCSPTAVNKCSNGVDGAAAGGWYLHNSDTKYKIGKVWLLPYHTNKDPNQATAVAYTWYDNLIISRTKVADPTSGPRPNPPTNVSAQ